MTGRENTTSTTTNTTTSTTTNNNVTYVQAKLVYCSRKIKCKKLS